MSLSKYPTPGNSINWAPLFTWTINCDHTKVIFNLPNKVLFQQEKFFPFPFTWTLELSLRNPSLFKRYNPFKSLDR